MTHSPNSKSGWWLPLNWTRKMVLLVCLCLVDWQVGVCALCCQHVANSSPFFSCAAKASLDDSSATTACGFCFLWRFLQIQGFLCVCVFGEIIWFFFTLLTEPCWNKTHTPVSVLFSVSLESNWVELVLSVGRMRWWIICCCAGKGWRGFWSSWWNGLVTLSHRILVLVSLCMTGNLRPV